MIQNVLFGSVWFSEVYFLPIYYQSARQLNLTTSALLLLPLVLTLSFTSGCSGQYISRTNRYGEVIWLGFFTWTLTAGLHLLFGRHTPIGTIAAILVFEGVGVGCIFQPSKLAKSCWHISADTTLALVAAQAHSSKADRAVVISARNFFRSLGGAIGLAISSAVFSNSLRSHLPSHLPTSLQDAVHSSTFATPSLTGLDITSRDHILDAYSAASRSVFILWTAMIGCCLVLTIFVKDRGLQREEEQVEANVEAGTEASTSEEKYNGQQQVAPQSDK